MSSTATDNRTLLGSGSVCNRMFRFDFQPHFLTSCLFHQQRSVCIWAQEHLIWFWCWSRCWIAAIRSLSFWKLIHCLNPWRFMLRENVILWCVWVFDWFLSHWMNLFSACIVLSANKLKGRSVCILFCDVLCLLFSFYQIIFVIKHGFRFLCVLWSKQGCRSSLQGFYLLKRLLPPPSLHPSPVPLLYFHYLISMVTWDTGNVVAPRNVYLCVCMYV